MDNPLVQLTYLGGFGEGIGSRNLAASESFGDGIAEKYQIVFGLSPLQPWRRLSDLSVLPPASGIWWAYICVIIGFPRETKYFAYTLARLELERRQSEIAEIIGVKDFTYGDSDPPTTGTTAHWDHFDEDRSSVTLQIPVRNCSYADFSLMLSRLDDFVDSLLDGIRVDSDGITSLRPHEP